VTQAAATDSENKRREREKTNLPEIVTQDEWLVARKELLAGEKEFDCERDGLTEARRRLPMVKVEKAPSPSVIFLKDGISRPCMI
jgi:hypothetical protein